MVASLRAQSALAMFPVSLGSSYRPALRWPGIPGLRSASRCPRPSTPSGLRRLRPVSATGGGLRALPQFSMVVLLRLAACNTPLLIGLTTACFRHWRRPSCAPALRLRGVPCLRTSCARHFSPSGLHLFASICSAKNARNDVHAVISDLSLVLPILCQCSGAHSACASCVSFVKEEPFGKRHHRMK